MLLRISLILAILAGLGAGGMAYYEFSTQIPQLEKQRNEEKDQKVAEITAHKKTQGELTKTKGELAQTQQELTDTKGERDKAVVRADAQEKRATDLQVKLTKTTSDLQEANDTVVSYKASGLTPDEVVKLKSNLTDAQKQIFGITGERDLWHRKFISVSAKLEALTGDPEKQFVKLPSTLKGTVVAVDPKWDFVVLNIGEDQGAVQDGEMLVSRGGRLVAKVIIHRVEKNRCIANVVPGWKLGDMIEGDVVVPAHPATS